MGPRTARPINRRRRRATSELIRRVKNYERLASKAIREKSRAAAVQALTLHPLVNSYSLACALTDAYIAHNKDYCDGWH